MLELSPDGYLQRAAPSRAWLEAEASRLEASLLRPHSGDISAPGADSGSLSGATGVSGPYGGSHGEARPRAGGRGRVARRGRYGSHVAPTTAGVVGLGSAAVVASGVALMLWLEVGIALVVGVLMGALLMAIFASRAIGDLEVENARLVRALRAAQKAPKR